MPATKTTAQIDIQPLKIQFKALIQNPRYNNVGPASALAREMEKRLTAFSDVNPEACVCKIDDQTAAFYCYVPNRDNMADAIYHLRTLLNSVLAELEG